VHKVAEFADQVAAEDRLEFLHEAHRLSRRCRK
jgi:hypothetical protein